MPQRERGAGAMDRRTFVRTTGGILVAATVGCGSDKLGPVRTGTVRVVLTGLDSSATSGGTAIVTPAAGGTAVTIDLPASGDQSASVPVGDYTVQYTPPANHQLAVGQAGTQAITISQYATTTVTFALVYVPSTTSGTIRVNVTGLTGTPSSGGTCVAQRTDAAGAPITMAVSGAGSGGNSSVPAGTYTVTYTPPAGFVLASGVTNPVTGLVVGVAATASVVFAVAASATGTIQVTVSGLTGSASDGGSCLAQRTDAAGTPISIPVTSAGSGSASGVPAGTYTVTYTPPGGFVLASGVTNPVTGLVVGIGATAAVAFGVMAQGGSGTPGNIYDFGFEDGTFGAFRNNSGTALSGIGWAIDGTTAARGSQSITHHVNADPNNQAYDAYYTAGAYYGEWYVRFAYKQSAGFDNSHAIKVLRVQRDYGTIYGSVMHNDGSADTLAIDASVSGSDFGTLFANVNLPEPTPSSLAGSWHFFELYVKVVDATHTNYKMWVDDVLYFDYQTSHPNTVRPAVTFNQFFFGSTFNSIATAGDVWYDCLGVGTQKMGIPA